jgi:hypothetical protein
VLDAVIHDGSQIDAATRTATADIEHFSFDPVSVECLMHEAATVRHFQILYAFVYGYLVGSSSFHKIV